MSQLKQITAQPGTPQFFNQLKDSVNSLTDRAKAFDNLTVRGPVGTSLRKSRNAISITIPKVNDFGTSFIAQVDSDATGKGFYNCYLQKYDATDWDTNTADQFDNIGEDTIIVANISEVGTTTTNALVAGDFIECIKFSDDEGNTRYIGKSGENNIKGAVTQEAAQSNLLISVKLINKSGAEVGSAFDCLLLSPDGATAANSALPRIATGKAILVTKISNGDWIVVNPTIIKSSVCP